MVLSARIEQDAANWLARFVFGESQDRNGLTNSLLPYGDIVDAWEPVFGDVSPYDS